jgi:Na+/H+ antiporter NhaD/arsenite permease-like protein
MVRIPPRSRIVAFLRKDIVLVIAVFAAAISMFFVRPTKEYVSYIDWKVLACLFCLMAVVAGLRESGVFDIMAKSLTRFAADARTVAFFVIGLTFFLSMAITNDVALITLVPFSLIVLKNIDGNPRDRITIITLQTIAANVGSSLTPVGNPQNLYLFSHYGMIASDFFLAIGPIVLVGGIFLFFAIFTVRRTPISQKQTSANYRPEPLKILAYVALFTMSVLAVFRVIDYRIATAIVVTAMAAFNRKLFFKVDYSLLFTFVGFFVFIGNLQRIDAVRLFLTSLAKTDIVLVSALASQFISNVPAAILFSRFTENAVGLLRGVSIGGMGTIIASLASVISFKFFSAEYRQHSMRYLGVFTVWNILFFAVLYVANLFL